jgi:hypothetical protein
LNLSVRLNFKLLKNKSKNAWSINLKYFNILISFTLININNKKTFKT